MRWILFVVVGCSGKGAMEAGGDTGSPTTNVEPDTTSDCGDFERGVPRSEAALDGHTGDELLALLAGPREVTPTWFDGRAATVTLTATPLSDEVTVHDAANPGPGCPRWMTMDLRIDLTSDDGALAETWAQPVRWEAPWTDTAFGANIAVEDLDGTLDVAALHPTATALVARLGTDAGGSHGSVRLVDAGSYDTGNPDRSVDVCEWDDQ